MDICDIEAIDLQDLHRITIGHNGSGDGQGWYLEKIILKVPIITEDTSDDENAKDHNNEKETSYRKYTLHCER